MSGSDKGGRPPHVPTPQQRFQAEILASTGWTQDQIAKFMGIGEKTLQKHYKDELKSGKDKVGMMLSLTLMQQALKGKLPALFFALKTQYRWRENVGIQQLGKNGEPIDFNRIDTGSLESLLDAIRAGISGGTDRSNPGPEEE